MSTVTTHDRTTEITPDPESETLPHVFGSQVAIAGAREAFPAWNDQPALTWNDYGRLVEHSAQALARLGVERGDVVAMLLSPRREFHWIDFAIAHVGATSVSLYATAPASLLRFNLADTGARVLITESAFLEKATELASSVDHVFLVDGEAAGLPSWESALEARDPTFDVSARAGSIDPDDVALIVYTSGTTGMPKGVELTHRNLVFLARALQARLKVPEDATQLTYLPMAHIMARAADHYLQAVVGFGVAHCPDTRAVADHVLLARPSAFSSTPRLWDKLRSSILQHMEAEPDPARKQRMHVALEHGMAAARERQERYRAGDTSAEVAEPVDEEILRDLRAVVGLDRIRAALIGGAPTDAGLIEFYHALGIPLGDAYGFSEASAAVCANPPERVRFGTVGPALKGVQLKLADDGEVLLKSPGVMKGYRNRPEDTAAAFDEDGWLRSGDIGVLEPDGYLRLIDRKKHIIINSAGKNMSPAYIEGKLTTASPLIGTAVVIGDGRLYNVALLVLDAEGAAAFGRARGLSDTSPSTLAGDPAIRAEVAAAVERANEQLARVEQIKSFHILGESWVPDGVLLTATMKVRRAAVEERYAAQIDALYAS